MVRTPGAREREESREVAKVRVTKGFFDVGLTTVVLVLVTGGRCGSSLRAEEAGKSRRPSEGGVP